MLKYKNLATVLALVFLAFLIISPVLAKENEVLSGRELLKAIRQLQGQAAKPAYENRLKEAEKLQKPKEKVKEEEPAAEKKIEIKPKEKIVTEGTTKPADKIKPEPIIKPTTAAISDKLFSMIPAESLFVVRINKFNFTLNQIDQYLAGASPMPLGLSMIISMQLSQALGSPDLKGLDMGGSFAIFALETEGETFTEDLVSIPLTFALVPVTDYKLFISGNTNISEADSEEISKISLGDKPSLLVKQVGDFALITIEQYRDKYIETAKTITDKSKAGIAAVLEAEEAKQAIEKPLWLFIDTQNAAKGISMMASEQLMGLSMMTGGAIPAETEDINTAELLNELRFVSLSLTPKPNVLNINATIAAESGSETANMLSANSETMAKLIEITNAQKPSSTVSRIAEISALIPNASGTDFVGTYNLLQPLASAAAMMSTAEQQIPQAKSSLAFAIKCGKDKLTADIALPKEHLIEVMMTALTLFGPQVLQGPVSQPDSFGPTIPGDIKPGKVVTEIEVPISEEEGTVTAIVRTVDFPQMYGKENDKFKLPMVTKLPGTVLAVTGGELEKAVAIKGQNILPKEQWDRKISFPELEKDNRTVSFEVTVLYPNDQIKALRELDGNLEYFTSKGKKEFGSGTIDFKAGSKINEPEATIKEVELDEGDTYLTLELNIPPEAILSAKIYDLNGSELTASRAGWGKSGNKSTITFLVNGELPASGKMILEVAQELQKHKIAFKARNIALLITEN